MCPPGGDQPCGQNACEIQACLKKHDFVIEKEAILELKHCCEEFEYKSKHCGELSGLIKTIDRKKKVVQT